MTEEKEKLIPQSYRLPEGQVEFIDMLVGRRILGSNRSAVVRAMLSFAIKDLTETEFVRKHLETLKLLRSR